MRVTKKCCRKFYYVHIGMKKTKISSKGVALWNKAKKIIPGGRCVKGINFKNYRDVGYIVTNAKIYEARGC